MTLGTLLYHKELHDFFFFQTIPLTSLVHIIDLGFVSFGFCVFQRFIRKEYSYRSHSKIGLFHTEVTTMLGTDLSKYQGANVSLKNVKAALHASFIDRTIQECA